MTDVLTIEEYNELLSDSVGRKNHPQNQKKKNKYHATKTQVDGYAFDSKAEASRYLELRVLVWGKVIEGLQIHPSFVLLDHFEYRGEKVRGITYEADFSYYEAGNLVVEDVKGVRTKDFLLKQKLFKHRYPEIDFRLVA